ncbi:hypothetical protein CBR_g20456 [Chara braunii]|uniref:SMP domain-containing protein n=1 Tax=Chara braunii TaxID=69332 RepID=A0A388JUG7_CHABU|nr:hypothetical protein CBR_g20456 [Chara braunii]|eukprot:GBG61425.1 hypothetical protein CBR_g20456 [Chara braunii]
MQAMDRAQELTGGEAAPQPRSGEEREDDISQILKTAELKHETGEQAAEEAREKGLTEREYVAENQGQRKDKDARVGQQLMSQMGSEPLFGVPAAEEVSDETKRASASAVKLGEVVAETARQKGLLDEAEVVESRGGEIQSSQRGEHDRADPLEQQQTTEDPPNQRDRTDTDADRSPGASLTMTEEGGREEAADDRPSMTTEGPRPIDILY